MRQMSQRQEQTTLTSSIAVERSERDGQNVCRESRNCDKTTEKERDARRGPPAWPRCRRVPTLSAAEGMAKATDAH